MNAEFYVEILERHIPEIRKLMGRHWRLQQDNDPKHTSRLAQSFINENIPELLNPIENLWNLVKKDLIQFMVEKWNSIPNSVLKNLVNSMKRRCELIIENNGERISY